jgi:hypothetical protein
MGGSGNLGKSGLGGSGHKNHYKEELKVFHGF